MQCFTNRRPVEVFNFSSVESQFKGGIKKHTDSEFSSKLNSKTKPVSTSAHLQVTGLD